ncbi:MAG: molybdopterin oxidoreductase family protein [Rhodospirillales bacterium]|nr:molybdopterin oxidoreductase family protein [Rhodospirillales bacterium]
MDGSPAAGKSVRKRTLTERLFGGQEQVDTSPKVADEVKYTTCYMCACRCGIKVHLLDGRIRYIEGNRNHPINRGVLCAKGSAGIMQQYSPAKLTKPLRRVGERGAGEFKEIEWDEALGLASEWLGRIRASDPRKLAFFTGRDQSQSLTGWWAAQFGTPNFAAHGGFCSVNMAAAGLYTVGGSFWEFGEPDWERSEYFLMFGVAEDHDSNPIKLGISRLKARGAKFVSVNPVKTGYSAVADEWIGIRPGTDGLFVFALIHELLRADRIDLDFLARYTNAPWLVIRNPGQGDDGLFTRDAEGNPLAWDAKKQAAVNALGVDVSPAIAGEVTLPDGRKAVPVFQLLAERYLDPSYAPDEVAKRCGVPADTIRRIAAELAHAAFAKQIVLDQPWTDWAGRRHDKMIGRPVAMHAMRGISAHSNGFHTCRAIHVLQMLLGAVDTPGSWRYKAPFPRSCPPPGKPGGKTVAANTPLGGMPLGFPLGPEDLLVEADGTPQRIDKAYSWEAPVAAHGLMHMVITNAWKGDPYPIDTLFMYMSNMSWNSAMNTAGTIGMLTDKDPATGEYKIPRIIYSDAYFSEMVAYADLLLPDTTYLERWDCISLLDRPIGSAEGPADSIRQPVIKPDRDVRPFQEVLIDLGARLKLPGLTNPDGTAKYPGGYPDYIANHESKPGIGPLAGWRGEDGESHGTGPANPRQLDKYIEHQCFWHYELPADQLYYKHANRNYLETAKRLGFIDKAEQIVLQLYSEPLQKFRLAARGFGPVQPPDRERARIEANFDPLPIWHMPFEEAAVDNDTFPLHAITQRPMPMYHSWGSQNAWLRQIMSHNRLYMNRRTAASLGIADDDWVWVTSHHNRVKAQVRLMEGVNPNTVWTWNAIGKRAGAWNLAHNAPEAVRAFLLNHVISELLPERNGYRYSNSDPVTGQAAWYDLRVRVEKADAVEAGETAPSFPPLKTPPGLASPPSILRYGADFKSRDAAEEGGK